MQVVLYILSIFLIAAFSIQDSRLIYSIEKANVTFISDAPLEEITAKTTGVKGLVNFTDNTFAISVDMKTFAGFNSQMQREHFNENYIESNKYPLAYYKGKIIEPVDLNQKGKLVLRSKGDIEIHGIAREVIIPIILTIEENRINLEADFNINLSDFKISIPRIVSQKISENIEVRIDAELSLYKSSEN